jgi:hypothetical protein
MFNLNTFNNLDGYPNLSGKPDGTEIKWDTSASSYADDVNLLGDNIDNVKKNAETFIHVSMEVRRRKLNICCCLVARIQAKIWKMCHS